MDSNIVVSKRGEDRRFWVGGGARLQLLLQLADFVRLCEFVAVTGVCVGCCLSSSGRCWVRVCLLILFARCKVQRANACPPISFAAGQQH
mmetsp:Transcript_84915/g.186478  ORF Transcript_84915/g.186478 Transcript_84915/m.186478 type:complete len:90 (+) Transcript_84915:71-340(+)